MKWSGFRVSHDEVVELAVEALHRSNHAGVEDGTLTGHPEDVAAALVPALEAVAVGFARGYQMGLADGRA